MTRADVSGRALRHDRDRRLGINRDHRSGHRAQPRRQVALAADELSDWRRDLRGPVASGATSVTGPAEEKERCLHEAP